MKMEKIWWLPYLIAGICLLIGTIFDYQISSFLYQPHLLFGVILEQYVLWVFIVGVTFVFTMLHRIHRNFLYIIPEGISALYAVIEIGKYIMDINEHWLLVVVLACGVLAFCNLVVYRIPLGTLQKLKNKGVFYLAVLITSIVITFLLKNLWGRIRFRDLQAMEQFTNWYLPQGFQGNFSFPSGHVTTASAILCLLVTTKENIRQKTYVPVVIFVYTFIVCMAVSRIIMGAHYVSDVTMGFVIVYTVFLIYRMIFYRKRYL